MAYKPKSHHNVVEWTDGDEQIHVSITQKKVQNRIKKMAKDRPEEVTILGLNEDGSLEALIPYECFRLTLWKKAESMMGKEFGTPFPKGNDPWAGRRSSDFPVED